MSKENMERASDQPAAQYSHDADGISNLALWGRRLSRPQSYVRAAEQLRDDLLRWPMINRTIQQSILAAEGEFSIVQIGANDGNRNDPARPYVRRADVNALLVEPVPGYFEQLRENYRNAIGVQCAQVAIDATAGTAQMWEVDSSSRLRGSSSMHREVIDSAAWVTGDRDVSGLLHQIEVPTRTLPGLLEEHDVSRVDWLVVDTEGHDKVVLDQVTPDFVAATGLSHVLWERMHLPRGEQRELRDRFEDMGFDTYNLRRDTFATLPDAA
jgi:FkbM family methyltransferase